MANMEKEYGDKKGKSVFYATANKKHETAKDEAKEALSRPSKRKK